jgi:uncharacterized protein YutE (UPF0331/DUF86 family)
MDERVIEHLKYLNKYCLLLAEIKKRDFDDFMKDPMLQGSAERFLQLAIESCLNIGNRILSLYQFVKPTATPETYADIFIQLKTLGVIDKVFCDRLVKMAKFRNRLVHLYWEIDKDNLYEIIQDNLEDFSIFQKNILAYLKDQKEDDKK